MKVTFPHMGDSYIPVKAMLEESGVEVILPPNCSKRTLEIGVKISPEFICIPFKIIIGNFIEGIERGADTVFMISGGGPCRLGIFHAVQKDILDDMGYKIKMITTDNLTNLSALGDLYNTINLASRKKNSRTKMIRTLLKGYKLLNEADELHKLFNYTRPRELHKGQVDSLCRSYEQAIKQAYGLKETECVIKKYVTKIKGIRIDPDKDIFKVGLVGDIYTIEEPFINLNIEKKLGNMGIFVDRSITALEFIKEQLDFLPFIKSDKKEIHEAGAPYINHSVGGHGRNTVGNAILYKEKGYDGVIHLLPFTCMPEIVAQSILPTVMKEHDLPILTLVIDEMTSETGYITRLEAFIELLKQRRENTNIKNHESEQVLSSQSIEISSLDNNFK
ncbi:hypothetical protein [Haloplasma contractile]|uniref:2-hydroxyglutaryl-CoA dehydratase activator-related protein n=1 Tax=Haloplasma contractile SSD-17B TaxID=1033810 RepID=F7Q1L8_9MOLU|nr:hypothetical protein [Haloplasma contractile]ERJ12948.1 2-hydroxyglutaryl-CoA dehydratase activator-related protein [Haloplasma contractile SSD-17B]